MKKILITGASGFIGRALQKSLSLDPDLTLRGVVRRQTQNLHAGVEKTILGDLTSETDWASSLEGIDSIVHLAGRAHILHESATDALTEFRRINVAATINLAQQAVQAHVKRFIFISSVKVNGEWTLPGKPFTANDDVSTRDPYGISKHEAEQGLLQLAKESGLEVVIIRPPLIYGPGVKANFLSLMRWLYRGLPLPLGAIHNKRSLLSLSNLIDLIITCLQHPAAANQIFLASDGEDLSTTDLLRRLAFHLGKHARLIPIPQRLLEMSANLLGLGPMSQRLCSSLQVDISKTRELLNWAPPISIDQALEETAKYFLKQLT